MEPRDEQSPRRALASAIGVMAGVALLVGLAIGLVAVAVLKFAGIGEVTVDAEARPSATLVMPSYSPTRSSPEDGLSIPGVPSSPSPEFALPSGPPSPRGDKITLFAAPAAVGPGERINLSGVFPDGDGRALQVQRKENGAWTDFPVSARVAGGVFETWIQTSRTGVTLFRVFDRTSGRGSNAVTVAIGVPGVTGAPAP